LSRPRHFDGNDADGGRSHGRLLAFDRRYIFKMRKHDLSLAADERASGGGRNNAAEQNHHNSEQSGFDLQRPERCDEELRGDQEVHPGNPGGELADNPDIGAAEPQHRHRVLVHH